MAILPLLTVPDPRLLTVAQPVREFTPELGKFVEDLVETMYAAPACGLSAPQVGVSKRIFVLDMEDSDQKSCLQVFVNPQIQMRAGSQVMPVSCLSVPGLERRVIAPARIRVLWQDPLGKVFEQEFSGALAIAIMHKTDHLDGIVFERREDVLGTIEQAYDVWAWEKSGPALGDMAPDDAAREAFRAGYLAALGKGFRGA